MIEDVRKLIELSNDALKYSIIHLHHNVNCTQKGTFFAENGVLLKQSLRICWIRTINDRA